MALALTQATKRRSGGLSMRQGRRAGSAHRENAVKSRRMSTGRKCPPIASVAILADGPDDPALGSPGSPQGDEFKHVPVFIRLPEPTGSRAAGRVVRSGPQQHEEPRHCERHLQCSECASWSRWCRGDIADAASAPTGTKAYRKMAASHRQGRSSKPVVLRGPEFTREGFRCGGDRSLQVCWRIQQPVSRG
jgi:hypothetical protein